jgi:hypothetical protein
VRPNRHRLDGHSCRAAAVGVGRFRRGHTGQAHSGLEEVTARPMKGWNRGFRISIDFFAGESWSRSG